MQRKHFGENSNTLLCAKSTHDDGRQTCPVFNILEGRYPMKRKNKFIVFNDYKYTNAFSIRVKVSKTFG